MIWHFLEVWFLLLGAFAIGCSLGAALYAGIGNSMLATAQGALADSIGDMVDRAKARFGLGPDWRDGFRVRVPVERPLPKRRVRRRRIREESRASDDETYDDDDADYGSGEIAALSRAITERARDRDVDRDWRDEDDYERRDNREREDAYEDETDVVYADEPFEKDAPDEPVGLDESVSVESVVAKRPAGLLAPRNGVPDHLQRIRGIGKGNEELLNGLGIFHFGQIASWTPAEAQWVAAQMPFPERIERDDWIGQATVLASGGETGYVKSAERRRARRAASENGDDEDQGD